MENGSFWGRVVWGSIFAFALFMALAGCAERRPVMLEQGNIASITYQPKRCERLPDQRIRCKVVTFTEKTVSVQQLKRGGK